MSQLFDSNGLSLSASTFACRADALSRRHVVDVFATIAWFRALAAQAKASSIADMVRVYGAPSETWSDKLKWSHRDWAARSKGARRPRVKTIQAADAICPGSAAMFDLALWPALHTEWDFGRCLADVCRLLPAHIERGLAKQLQKTPDQLGDGCTKKMGTRGTLDDLACLLILLRRANAVGSGYAGSTLAKRVNRVLLLQAGWLLAHGLLRPLVEYVDKKFFRQVPKPFNLLVTAGDYFLALGCLVKAVPHHLPEVGNGFDPDLWFRGADLALSYMESI